MFEGRGWGVMGAHARGHNHDSLGVAILGNFNGKSLAVCLTQKHPAWPSCTQKVSYTSFVLQGWNVSSPVSTMVPKNHSCSFFFFFLCLLDDPPLLLISDSSPSAAAISSAKQLLQFGVSKGHISPGFTLLGHKDLGQTACPGNNLYSALAQIKG